MKLRGLLIDPFQRKVHWVNVQNDINDWHRLMDCQTLDVVQLDHPQDTDIWVDDEGLLREPPYPFFKWAGYNENLCGYGLVLCHNGPESTSVRISPDEAASLIQWEPWESRLPPEPYFDQLSRLYLDRWEGSFGQGAKNL